MRTTTTPPAPSRRLRWALAAAASLALVTAPVGASPAQAAPAATDVVIDEVESSGGNPGDFIELVDRGADTVDLAGWTLRDDDDTHALVLPTGTEIAPGGHLAIDTEPAFGLGAADSARLFDADGTLVDSYSWTAHATTTYGRCPDATGDFTTTASSTRGAANDCAAPSSPAPASPWPGGASVRTVDAQGYFGENVSGLAYVAGAAPADDTLWAVKNGPGTLYRLGFDGTDWVPRTSGGALLHYPDGTGDVDAEGVAVTSRGILVSSERDNDANTVSRPSVLLYDPAVSGGDLSAVREWNLAGDLPAVAPNSGLEAIAEVPDAFLTAHGFVDETTGAAYDPARYPDHGDGLVFVGLEATGGVYAYALDAASGAATRVATIASGFTGVMELEFEPERQALWAVCDDTCDGRSALLTIGSSGAFAPSTVYERPTGMPNLNNEGFAIAPQSRCVDGVKTVVWSDDSDDDGHALRQGTIACMTPAVDPAAGQAVGDVADAAPALAETGSDPAAVLVLAALLCMVGTALIVARRRVARR